MNGAKRGLFSNEAGSGSAPCAAAAADISHPAKEGLLQALGVFIDTLVICSCSAMIMLLTPEELTRGLEGMDLLQAAMGYHLGEFGVIFTAVILWLFSFSTFLGILFYARSNVAYLFGDSWGSQTLYKLLALAMLFVGGLAIGLNAHMDTATDLTGTNVRPRIIRAYDGGIIDLNEEIQMDPQQFPILKEHIGDDLIVTDGNTLLGADDKAGIAIIMTALEQMIERQMPHGDIYVAFTPDEEVGRGTEHFDLNKFRADFAYTVDGGAINEIDYENFNAAQAQITIQGKSIHPGTAKNKMVNASLLAMQFHALLPIEQNPAYTEGYEGFNHLLHLQGECDHAQMTYIIRNHDDAKFEAQKQLFIDNCAFLNKRYGDGTFTLKLVDQYRNMRSIIEKDMRVIELAKRAIAAAGETPVSSPVRGGTDGAALTYMGMPCPNFGTGSYNHHGRYEFASIADMTKMVEIITNVLTLSKAVSEEFAQ